MNTPAHLILGVAAFGKPGRAAVIWAAMTGAMMPDLSLYVMAGVAIFILGHSPDLVFREFYFSDAWQQVFAIDNSFILWGIGLAVARYLKSDVWVAFCAAALLHILLDFPLHNEDARMHFWPITDWKFYSPFSYWDTSSGGGIIGILELVLVIFATIFVWWRFQVMWVRILITVLALMQIAPFVMWQLFF